MQRRVQLALAEALTAGVIARRLIDQHELCCPLLDLRYALDNGRAQLRKDRQLLSLARIAMP